MGHFYSISVVEFTGVVSKHTVYSINYEIIIMKHYDIINICYNNSKIIITICTNEFEINVSKRQIVF